MYSSSDGSSFSQIENSPINMHIINNDGAYLVISGGDGTYYSSNGVYFSELKISSNKIIVRYLTMGTSLILGQIYYNGSYITKEFKNGALQSEIITNSTQTSSEKVFIYNNYYIIYKNNELTIKNITTSQQKNKKLQNSFLSDSLFYLNNKLYFGFLYKAIATMDLSLLNF